MNPIPSRWLGVGVTTDALRKELAHIIRLSEGNSKIGKTWNHSKVPVETCPKDVPCHKECYARKSYQQYEAVREAWNVNTASIRLDETGWFRALHRLLGSIQPAYYRGHVAGDFESQSEVNAWCGIAILHPETRFLFFTKRKEFDYSNLPVNLIVRASQWGDYEWGDDLPKAHFGKADDAFKCNADNGFTCDKCRFCWEYPRKDVWFPSH